MHSHSTDFPLADAFLKTIPAATEKIDREELIDNLPFLLSSSLELVLDGFDYDKDITSSRAILARMLGTMIHRLQSSDSVQFTVNTDALARCRLMFVDAMLPMESDDHQIKAALDLLNENQRADSTAACTCQEIIELACDLVMRQSMTAERAGHINQAIENLTGVSISRPLIEAHEINHNR